MAKENLRAALASIIRLVLRDGTYFIVVMVAEKPMVEVCMENVKVKKGLITGKATVSARDYDGNLIRKYNPVNATLPIKIDLPTKTTKIVMTFVEGLFNSISYQTEDGSYNSIDFVTK
ncbi:MAG: hypothetical protein ACKOW9_00390 [Candidatus Paceibacterota bacterium]